MPATYDTESAAARALPRFAPSPAMIPDRIGIIGSTHGVKASSSPNPRKLAITSAKLPSNSRATSTSLA